LDFKKCHALEIGVRGHSKSLKVVPFDKIVYGFLLVFISNIPKTHHFWDIRLQKFRDLENRVRVPSRSLEISPFDRAHTTSYWRSIVTIWLYLVYFLRYSISKNVVTLKSGLEVTQGHWN